MEEKIISDVVKSVINSMQNKKVTLEIARKLIHKVELKAKEMGVKAVVAVANDGKQSLYLCGT